MMQSPTGNWSPGLNELPVWMAATIGTADGRGLYIDKPMPGSTRCSGRRLRCVLAVANGHDQRIFFVRQ